MGAVAGRPGTQRATWLQSAPGAARGGLPATHVRRPHAVPRLQMSGTFKVDGSGNVELKETDGIDYAPVTVQLPGGERVPFLFSVKELDAKVGPASHGAVMTRCRAPRGLEGRGSGGSARRACNVLTSHRLPRTLAGQRRRLWRRVCGALLPRLHLPGPQGPRRSHWLRHGRGPARCWRLW